MRSRRVSGRGTDCKGESENILPWIPSTVEPVIGLLVFPGLGHNLVRAFGTSIPNHSCVDRRISPRERGHAKH